MPRALLVEDNNTCARIAMAALRAAGYDVERAGSARGARAALDGRRFDLYVVDIQIAETERREAPANGLDLATLIRVRHPRGRIVVWSSTRGAEVEARCGVLGASWLPKDAGSGAKLLRLAAQAALVDASRLTW